MKAELIGLKAVKFTNQDTGELVSGTKFHFAMEDKDVYGRSAEAVFFTDKKMKDLGIKEPQVGQLYDVSYNKYGKVADLVLTDG